MSRTIQPYFALESARVWNLCSKWVTTARAVLTGVCCVVALVGAGCGNAIGTDPEVDRVAIEALLNQYLPKLAAAYATGDMTVLEGVTVPKEQATIQRFVNEFEAQGRVFEIELKSLTVEKVNVFKYSSAFVNTLEVWDVRQLTLGTRILINQDLGQRNRVTYSMKRKDHGWVVLSRTVRQTLE